MRKRRASQDDKVHDAEAPVEVHVADRLPRQRASIRQSVQNQQKPTPSTSEGVAPEEVSVWPVLRPANAQKKAT